MTMRVVAALAGATMLSSLIAAPAFSSDSASVSAAKTELAKYSGLPKWVAPGPNINAKAISKNKTVMVVPYLLAIPYNAGFADAVTLANAKAGFKKTTVWASDGSVTSWAAGITQGIADHVAVIDLISGVAAAYVQPQINQARAAGIVVIGSTNDDPSVPTPKYLSGVVPLDYALAGKLEADYATVSTGGNVNCIIVTSTQVPPSLSMTPVVEARVSALGGKFVTINVQPADWASPTIGIAAQVQAKIAADPTINYVLPNYDGEAPLVLAGINAAGKAGKIGVASFNGTPDAMKLVQAGTLEMNVGEDLAWAGYATTDANLRALLKPKAVGVTYNENLPFIIFTKKNANNVGVPPNLTDGYGNVHLNYLKVWGVK
jgi:ribose transport system substrate-binding protein